MTMKRGGLLTLLFLLSEFACYREYPPARPNGIPTEAVWAGGVDGGGWVHCSTSSLEFNECTIYDEEGRSSGPAHYVLRNSGTAAKAEELRYTYLTGAAIGLESGSELVRIENNR